MQNAPLDEHIDQFLVRKKAEGKPFFVYMTAGTNKFLRIYYGKVGNYLAALDVTSLDTISANPQ